MENQIIASEIKENQLIASEGKVLRRKSDGFIYGKVINLGYTYFINGIKLPEPHLDVPEDFEEIDEPTTETRSQGGNK